MKEKILIINADDCNLTPKVTEAILKAHQNGIVTSTTFMINLATSTEVVQELVSSKKLGVGLHLNLTLGEPVSKKSLIPSLLQKDGRFKKQAEYLAAKKFPSMVEVAEEFNAQLQRFIKIFKRPPTHVDIHHHLHDHLSFFKVLAGVAKKYDLPIRWSRLFVTPGVKMPYKLIKTTEHFYGNLDPHTFWTEEVLRHLLLTLPEGTNEIMCHPGWVDEELCAISSLTYPREREYQLFGSKDLRKYIAKLGIRLTHFGWFKRR